MKEELSKQGRGKEDFILEEYGSLEVSIKLALNSLGETRDFLRMYPRIWSIETSILEISNRMIELEKYQELLSLQKTQKIALDEEVVAQVIGAIMDSEQTMIDIEGLIFGDSKNTTTH